MSMLSLMGFGAFLCLLAVMRASADEYHYSYSSSSSSGDGGASHYTYKGSTDSHAAAHAGGHGASHYSYSSSSSDGGAVGTSHYSYSGAGDSHGAAHGGQGASHYSYSYSNSGVNGHDAATHHYGGGEYNYGGGKYHYGEGEELHEGGGHFHEHFHEGYIAGGDSGSEWDGKPSYDCDAGYSNWRAGWSHYKKKYCCLYAHKGCEHHFVHDSLPYDCAAGYSNWKAGWSRSKKDWCCSHEYKGCGHHATYSLPYDCDAGFSNWRRGWSEPKKAWCCSHANKGCQRSGSYHVKSEPYDCDAGFSNWKAGWSWSKKHWCCEHTSKGCEHVHIIEASQETDQRLPYDCHAGFSNWRRGWSESKKDWCCSHANKGCETEYKPEPSEPYDCSAGFSNWKAGWSESKKDWCCQNYNKGCAQVSLPFDCDAGYSNWKAGWSKSKKVWCCSTYQKGCEVPSLPFDCDAGYSNWKAGWSEAKKEWCCKHAEKGCVLKGPEHICDGAEEEWADCKDQPRCEECSPVDCVFSSWTRWFAGQGCLGLEFRHRSIEVRNNKCGLPCLGSKIESRPLSTPKPECRMHMQDCVFSSWGQWSQCENVQDQSIRNRHVENPPLNGGLPCKGVVSETRPCGGPEPRPCVFDAWHEWTTCSASCGEGRHTRMRRIRNEDRLDGQTCDDAMLETKTCMLHPCPSRDCILSSWSGWSRCGLSTWQATRHRMVRQSPEGEGMGCNATLVETKGCEAPNADDCILSAWSAWTKCDKTCDGGQQTRHRTVIQPSRNGGSCPWRSLQEIASCQTQLCTGESDCLMSPWGQWSMCSAMEGPGFATRKRRIDIFASGAGKACGGTLSETKACMIKAEVVVDCVWGSWESWGACSATCGGGARHRTRAVLTSPRHGGAACEANDKEEVAPCSTQSCEEKCTDGDWSSWDDWSQCSSSCDAGYRKRSRSVETKPNDCGSAPTGPNEEFELCQALPPCIADADCQLSDWSSWGNCSATCSGIRERSRHIQSLAEGNGKSCDDIELSVIEACNPVPGEAAPSGCEAEPALDCLMDGWGSWSTCSATCGGGQQMQSRKVMRHSSGGGRPCSDSTTLTRGCNTIPCGDDAVKDCEWEEWSQWSECKNCGDQRTRYRGIAQLPNIHGKMCDARDGKEVSNCTSHCASVARTCAWTEWSSSSCPDSCGSNTVIRRRELSLTEGGSDFLFLGDEDSKCFGSQSDVAKCPTNASCIKTCEPQACEFGEWGEWKEESCTGLCERQRVIGTMNNECGEPCDGPLLETKRCESTCDQPIDCKLSSWTMWSDCQNATSHLRGQRYRSRQIDDKPEKGGRACNGDLMQTKACEGDMAQPCVFGTWGVWDTCSTSCGKGFQKRMRRIAQEAEDGGQRCVGNLEEVQECHAGDYEICNVPEDCALGDWSEWGECGFSLQRERHRDFTKKARLGGLPCLGALSETETCHHNPVDCEISDWTAWDTCDRTCGAGQTRRQRQISRFPKHGGALCPEDLVQIKGCHIEACAVRDCQVSGWLEWGDCSVTCGPGHQSRVRTVLNLREAGGAGCFFSLGENRPCGLKDCSQDCEWGHWDEWSACTKSCGGGIMKRTRSILTIPTAGGELCDDNDMKEILPCNVGECNEICVDGMWGEWEEWAECSRTCAGGETYRRREVSRMANSCGKPAEGEDKEVKFCNVEIHCEPARDCLFTAWTSWNQCSASCDGVMMRSRKVAQFGHGSGLFCEGALKEIAPCNPGEAEQPPAGCQRGPPVDCITSDWTPWADCTATCDGGEQSRSRTVLQHPKHGGFGCHSGLKQVRECNRDACAGIPKVDCVYGDWKDWAACGACNGERKRTRKILIYPSGGGLDCSPADTEDVGRCPHLCDTEAYCEWTTWSEWGSCTTTCGTGGRKKRVRHLEKLSMPIAQAKQQEQHQELLQRYDALYQRTKDLELGQTQEVFLAFTAGALSLLAVATVFRGRRAVAPPGEASDAETLLVNRI